MKQMKYFFMALMCLMMSASCVADDRIIPVEQLPAAAKTFIQKNFPGRTISYAQEDRDGLSKTYEARLDDGTEVKFDKKGNWDKVDCEMKAVPAALVPATIANYVKNSFPGAFVVKIDKERYGYEIELSNDLELKFDKRGNLMNIDD